MNSAKSTRRVSVALEDRVADVPAPHGKTLALALLEVAPAHDGPARVAGEDPVARLNLVVQICEASEAREWAADLHERLELPRVHVLPVAGDVPAAREDETRFRRRVVEHRLGVPVEYPCTPRGTSTTSTPSHPATARLMTWRSFVAPGMTVIRPLNLSSFPTLSSRHTPTTSYPRSSACSTTYCPSFPEAPTTQTLIARVP